MQTKFIKGRMLKITTTAYRNLSENGVTPQELNEFVIFPMGTYELGTDINAFLSDETMTLKTRNYIQKIGSDRDYAYLTHFFFGVVTIVYYVFMSDDVVKDLDNYTVFRHAWNYLHKNKIVDEAIKDGFTLKGSVYYG